MISGDNYMKTAELGLVSRAKTPKAVSGKLGGDLLKVAKGSAAIGGSSIASALRAAMAGASGRTSAQMMSVLLSKAKPGDLLAGSGDGWQVMSGVALWADKSLTLRPEYVHEMLGIGAQVEGANFGDPGETLAKINDWTSEKTAGKIDKILTGLNPNDKAVITSTTYFKAAWASRFDRACTTDHRFSSTAGNRMVKMMSQTCPAMYGETEMFVCASLPFQGKRFSMNVVVPRGPAELEVLETDPAATLEMAKARMSPAEKVSVLLPKFRAESSVELVEPLRAMGMADAFDAAAADFSTMTGARDLFISRVAHKALVEADEDGATAAAATAVTFMIRGFSRVPEIRADRTFLFAIRDEVAGEDLFTGRFDG
jgi:serpin B